MDYVIELESSGKVKAYGVEKEEDLQELIEELTERGSLFSVVYGEQGYTEYQGNLLIPVEFVGGEE